MLTPQMIVRIKKGSASQGYSYGPPTEGQQRAISAGIAIAAYSINKALTDDLALMRAVSTAEELKDGGKKIPVFAVSSKDYWALSLP